MALFSPGIHLCLKEEALTVASISSSSSNSRNPLLSVGDIVLCIGAEKTVRGVDINHVEQLLRGQENSTISLSLFKKPSEAPGRSSRMQILELVRDVPDKREMDDSGQDDKQAFSFENGEKKTLANYIRSSDAVFKLTKQLEHDGRQFIFSGSDDDDAVLAIDNLLKAATEQHAVDANRSVLLQLALKQKSHQLSLINTASRDALRFHPSETDSEKLSKLICFANEVLLLSNVDGGASSSTNSSKIAHRPMKAFSQNENEMQDASIMSAVSVNVETPIRLQLRHGCGSSPSPISTISERENQAPQRGKPPKDVSAKPPKHSTGIKSSQTKLQQQQSSQSRRGPASSQNTARRAIISNSSSSSNQNNQKSNTAEISKPVVNNQPPRFDKEAFVQQAAMVSAALGLSSKA